MSRRRPSNQAPATSIAPVVMAIAVIGAAVAIALGWPGVPIIWLGLVVSAFSAVPATYSGRKDSSGYPTPANDAEEEKMASWRVWSDLRTHLIMPNGDWLPGWPILGAWLGAVTAAALGWCLPIDLTAIHAVKALSHFPLTDARLANAAAAFIVAVEVPAARRRVAGSDHPGTRVDSLLTLAKEKPASIVASAGIGGVAGAALAGVSIGVAAHHPHYLVPGSLTLYLACAVAGALLAVASPWKKRALDAWSDVVKARKEWAPRWAGLKFDPAPVLIAHETVGPAVVDTFAAPPHQGAMSFWALGPKIAPAMGSGTKIAVLECPDDGPNGPTPGTRHPLNFRVAAWPAAAIPSFSGPSTGMDDATAELLAHCAMVWALEPQGYGRPVPLGVERFSTEESATSAWATQWAWPDGPSLNEIRPLVDSLSQAFGSEVLVDHRADIVYAGALTGAGGVPQATFDDPGTAKDMENIASEDVWNARWSTTLKSDANPPSPNPSTYREATLPDGTIVHRQAFVTRKGVDPAEFSGLEPKLAASIGAAPFVAITGWPAKGQRRGERHPQAFAVLWSNTPVPPTPADLAPCDAADWVLAGLLNAAFDAAKLPRPEIVSTRHLMASGPQVWELTLRLYGGATLADVHSRAERLRQALGVAWLRVGPADDGCVIFAGSEPDQALLVDRERDGLRLTGLDWEKAWSDAGVIGSGGLLPELTAVSKLPHNEEVAVLDFNLPSGVDVPRVKGALAKLRASTNNTFVDLRESPHGASAVRLLASVGNPLPARVGFDFAAADALRGRGIPFATGVEGEPVAFDPLESPHILVAGVTGGGKSVLAQALLYGFAISGAHLVVIDPVKGGADFRFVEPYVDAFVSTPAEAANAMKAVYAEVVRRKDINTEHGVGSGLDLPEGVRYPHLVVLIDEFTSLMGQSTVPKASDDPEAEEEREAIIRDNKDRSDIGIFAGKLAREARSALVTLVLGTQKLSAKMLEAIPGSSDLKTNMARTLLGKASSGDRASALRAFDDAPTLTGDIPKGRGLWEPLSSAAVVVQCWFATQADLSAELAKRLEPVPPERKMDLTAPVRQSRPATDEVVDVGELSFSLDDLLDDGGASSTSEAQPELDGGPDEPAPSGPEELADDWGDGLDWGAPADARTDGTDEPAPSGPEELADDWGTPADASPAPVPDDDGPDAAPHTTPEEPTDDWGDGLDWGAPADASPAPVPDDDPFAVPVPRAPAPVDEDDPFA